MGFTKKGGNVNLRFDWDVDDPRHIAITMVETTLDGGNTISGEFTRNEIFAVLNLLQTWLRDGEKLINPSSSAPGQAHS